MSSVPSVGGVEGTFDGLEVVVADTATTRTVCSRGEIDLATASTVGDPLAAGLADGFETIVLDLGGTTFIDSTGIAMIVKMHASAREHGRRFIVLPGPPAVQRIFEICGLADEIPFATGQRNDLD